jgi:aromatic ring-opening dioxygenase catalytic subunit (LigB family)
MGSIVGAALVAHVPPIVLPEDVRREMNNGNDISLIDGLRRIRSEKLDPLDADTFVVVDTHWFTTIEHIVSAHHRRTGRFTSDELPRGNPQMPYDIVGDPDLARLIAAQADGRDDTWILATDDPYLAIHYPTVYLTPYLQGRERWVSTGVCQTASRDDFLLFGRLIGEAIRASDRRVVLLASGGLSHKFHTMREFRKHEASDPSHIVTPEARAADEQLIARLEAGDHAAVIEDYAAFRRFSPEGLFGHYLTMIGALGGASCTTPGTRFSEYESSAGTGQVHIWFDIPE